MYYTIYKTTCKTTGKYYIGKHKTKNINDSYMGSGVHLNRALKKYGRSNFTKEILYVVDTEDEMNILEALMVDHQDNMSMNMAPGGKGGWGYINDKGLNRGANNVMHVPVIKEKIITSAKKTRASNKEYYDDISRKNIQKAIEKNVGKKRPDHSKIMKKRTKELWENKKEKMRDALSGTYKLTSPNDDVIITNRLGEVCEKYGLPFTTIHNSYSNGGRIITKGKAKGWSCTHH